MSLIKFFQIIDNSFIGKFVNRKLKIIGDTDPQRIYVENIRRFYNIPFKAARFFCEVAVREHVFNKRVGINCPQCSKLIDHVHSDLHLPDIITCDHCEAMEEDKFVFTKSEYIVTEFYQLNNLANG